MQRGVAEAEAPDMTDLAKGPSATKADKNPRGGLSAAGRKKFGVKAGVKNYASASRKDKGRWVSWAMRFTGTPKPVKDKNGQPTRYALMFRAWGEPVPTSREAVVAVHQKAVRRSQQLKNADKRDKADLADLEVEMECSDCERSFLAFDTLLTHVENVHIEPTEATEAAHEENTEMSHLIECKHEDCARTFVDQASMYEHAEAVHTFDDVRRLVSEAVRETYGRQGDHRATPPVPSIWTWIEDLAADWVVFQHEEGNETHLMKASYSIVDGKVTLGEPTEVRRRTVYEPVNKES